ncbi:MAG: hypothetical protein PHY93_03535 [Bacteriovorax sp.]|nr:hypothetical protein [Bacteriovorax sp.]
MGAVVFNNEIFDSWLNKKAEQILGKVDREAISTEEMIVLILKAQTNHFYHMDLDLKTGLQEVRDEIRQDRESNKLEFQKIRHDSAVDMDKFKVEMKTEMTGLRSEIKSEMNDLRTEIKSEMNDLRAEFKADVGILKTELRSEMDYRFGQVDKRFDRINQYFIWLAGLIVASSGGLYLKLFFN